MINWSKFHGDWHKWIKLWTSCLPIQNFRQMFPLQQLILLCGRWNCYPRWSLSSGNFTPTQHQFSKRITILAVIRRPFIVQAKLVTSTFKFWLVRRKFERRLTVVIRSIGYPSDVCSCSCFWCGKIVEKRFLAVLIDCFLSLEFVGLLFELKIVWRLL